MCFIVQFLFFPLFSDLSTNIKNTLKLTPLLSPQHDIISLLPGNFCFESKLKWFCVRSSGINSAPSGKQQEANLPLAETVDIFGGGKTLFVV